MTVPQNPPAERPAPGPGRGRVIARWSLLLSIMSILAVALLPGANAYVNQPPVQILLSGPGRVVSCDRSVTITATVLGTATGKPVKSQFVHWDIEKAQSRGDRLSARRTITNSRGRTSVELTFGLAAGPREISATVTIVSPRITVRCAGGLPQAVPAPGPGDPEPAPPTLAAPQAVPSPASDPGTPAIGLRLERLALELPVVEGDGVTVPDGAAAHFAGTAWPGAGSNTFLYAHAREPGFKPLWYARTGDRIELDLADGSTALYEVTHIDPVVPWDDLSPLAPTSEERLTLQTCITFDPTAPRLVVVAERLDAGL